MSSDSQRTNEQQFFSFAKFGTFELYSAVVENMAEGVCLVDAHSWSIIYANPKFSRMFGYELGELDGKPVIILNSPESKTTPHQVADNIIGNIQKFGEDEYDIKNVKKDGSSFWCRGRSTTFSHPELGEVILAVHEDITQRKMVEESLQKAEHRYRELFELGCESIFELDSSGHILDVNEAGCELLDFKKSELLGTDISSLIGPVEVQNFKEKLFAGHPLGSVCSSRFNFVSRTGKSLPIEFIFKKISVSRIIAFGRDLREYEKNVAARLLSERKYRTLFETAFDAILVINESGQIVLANPQVEKCFGYQPGEILGRPIEILVPLKQRAAHILKRVSYMTSPKPRPMGEGRELLGLRKDGTEFPIDISLSPSETAEGYRVTAIVREVTEQRLHESHLQFLSETSKILEETMDYQERLQRMVDAIVPKMADFCVVGLFENGSLQPRAAAIRDAKQLEILKKAAVVVLSDEQAKEGETEENLFEELRLTSKVIFPLVVRGQAIGTLSLGMTDSGRKISLDDIDFVNLVSNRFAVALENALLYYQVQQAVRARENILSAVSHDLKNPAAAVEMAIGLLSERAKSESDIREIVDKVQSSVSLMQRLISDLLDFGKIQTGKLDIKTALVPITPLLTRALIGLEERAHLKEIKIEVQVPSDLTHLECDEDRIVQVLWNLVGNAIKFTPPRGQIQVEIFKETESVRFSVKDNGPGIQSDHLSKVFDRFWQAKETASLGTGLGLSIAKGVIDAHRGQIWVESEVGNGAKFQFRLPQKYATQQTEVSTHRPSEAEMSICPQPEAKKIDLRGVKILVIDDSRDNCFLLRRVLESAGAIVIEAHSGVEGLRECSLHRPDLTITDIEMPEGDGYFFIREIQSKNNGAPSPMPVVALTAHSGAQELEKIRGAGFNFCVTKPFTTHSLVPLLFEVLVRATSAVALK